MTGNEVKNAKTGNAEDGAGSAGGVRLAEKRKIGKRQWKRACRIQAMAICQEAKMTEITEINSN
jgi:hypothetical protein